MGRTPPPLPPRGVATRGGVCARQNGSSGGEAAGDDSIVWRPGSAETECSHLRCMPGDRGLANPAAGPFLKLRARLRGAVMLHEGAAEPSPRPPPIARAGGDAVVPVVAPHTMLGQ